jgi:TldD protein
MIKEKEYYLSLFGVDEALLAMLVREALSRGGHYSDLFFENTAYGNLVLRDGAVTSGGSHVDYGVGIRTLDGEKTGYAYSESTSKADMIACARAASAIACGVSAVVENATRAASRGIPNAAADRYPVKEEWRSKSMDSFLPFLREVDAEIRRRDARVEKLTAVLSFQETDVLMYNSLSELKWETRPMGNVNVSVVFRQGNRVENNSVSRSWRCGVEMLGPNLIKEIADAAVKGLDARFQAGRPKGGRMSVVMAAGASGILLHEAMGHAFEADFNRKGISIFADKMGQKICSEDITIVDDGTLPGNRGALNYDDEGVPGQRTVMVDRGVLSSYLHDRISAAHYGVAPTGNGRRESFRYAPIPRMRATYMESGSANPADIIADVKQGIYVDEFANGQVKIGEGDFTFYVKAGFLIENGRLTMPVKDINIIGNGPEALRDIVAVGSDLEIDPLTWVCGKEQSVPVSCGIPTVLVKSLTVGGE